MAEMTKARPALKSNASQVRVKKIAPYLGAEISGVKLAETINDADFQVIHDAFIKHEVLVFRNQKLTVDEYMAFARRFGELSMHPFSTSLAERPELIVLDNDKDAPPLSTDQWHSDEMFREAPALATIVRSTIIPEVGGNTLFASMTTAYDSLHPSLQEFLCTLEALHDFAKVFRVRYPERARAGNDSGSEDIFPNQRHPVVRVQRIRSGRKAIFVSPQTTKCILGVRDFGKRASPSTSLPVAANPGIPASCWLGAGHDCDGGQPFHPALCASRLSSSAAPHGAFDHQGRLAVWR